jgi:hypothetical protein
MMIKKAKKVIKWLLPCGIQKDILPRIKSIKKKDNTPQLVIQKAAEISKFKNKHQGERCFIIATGPSLAQQDLKKLQGEVCIGIHDAWLHPDIPLIKPRYHLIAPNHEPFTFEHIEKRLTGLSRTYQWPVDYFFGYRAYQYSLFDFLQKNPHLIDEKNCHYINYDYHSRVDRLMINDSNFDQPRIWDISKKPFDIQTGGIMGIQIAVFMGFSEIILLGMDHNFARVIEPNATPHFYGKEGQFDQIQYDHSFSREQTFSNLARLWKSYRLIKESCQLKGVQIINATPDSALDVFNNEILENWFLRC